MLKHGDCDWSRDENCVFGLGLECSVSVPTANVWARSRGQMCGLGFNLQEAKITVSTLLEAEILVSVSVSVSKVWFRLTLPGKVGMGRLGKGRKGEGVNFGYIGCSNDVIDIVDAQCSGRRGCSLRVLDENFMNMKPCHEDLKLYLSVQYSCVPGQPSSITATD